MAPKPSDEPCCIEDCENTLEYRALRMCNKHYRRWRRHGDPTVSGTRRGNAESREIHPAILEMVSNGMLNKQIAKRFGISQKTVEKVKRDNGFRMQDHRIFTDDELEKIEKMFEDGCSYAEIARTTGRSAATIAHKWPGRGWTASQAGAYAHWFTHKATKILK